MHLSANAYLAQGEAAEAAGNIEQALVAYLAALEQEPSSRLAQEKIAIFTVADNPSRAIQLAQHLGMRQSEREILVYLGYVSFRAWSHHQRRTPALTALRFWLSKQPSDKDQLIEAGDYAAGQGEPDLAIDAFARAFTAHPGSLLALKGWISQLLRAGRPVQAKKIVESVIQKAPPHTALQQLIGSCFAGLGEHSKAETAWQLAITLAPNELAPYSNLMYSSLARDDVDGAGLFNHARRFAAAVLRQAAPGDLHTWPALAATPAKNQRLRVGLASADLRLHPVGFFMAQFFEHYSREKIELIVLADSHANDPMVERFRAQAGEWHDTTELAAPAYARFVRNLQLDLLIDLAGHTSGHRLLELSWRLARKQATYLGYAGTTGGPALDARIADTDTELPSEAQNSSEAVIQMEGSYFCFSPYNIGGEAPLSELPAAKGQAFSFGCCTQHGKITPTAIKLWVDVLRALPKAKMRVRCREFSEASVRSEFARLWKRCGGNPAQLETAGWLMGGDHFRVYDDIDIVLNTYPFHLATNHCDALWMGVPVVSLLGSEHRSRMGLSINRAAMHPEWCAETPADFTAIALSLAKDLPALAKLRRELREQLRHSPLFNGKDFARRMENALTQLANS